MANSVVFVTESDLADLISASDLVSYLLIDVEAGASPSVVAERIRAEVDRVNAVVSSEFVANDYAMAMQMGLEMITLMTVIGGALAILVVAFSVYSQMSRQRRELAIARAIGIGPAKLFAAAALQAVCIGVLSVLLAVALSWLIVPLLSVLVPQLTLHITPESIARVSFVALVAAVIAPRRPGKRVERMMATGDKAIVMTERLVKTFGKGHAAVRAVDDVSLSVERGELILVMGPSGSGKTTLLSMIGGLLRPDVGRVLLDGIDITGLAEHDIAAVRALKVGFIFQAFNLLEALTVEENVLFPANLASGGVRAAAPRAEALIDRLGLTDRKRALPNTLSGGEKQRVAIARALINQPPLILADEPTGNLDSKTGQEVMMILHDIARDDGCAVMFVTHDPRVEDIADRILWLEDGALRDRKAKEHSWRRDPVCGMRVDEWTATVFTEHADQRYVFCSQRCLERFENDPAPYMLGGE
jgi:putative ABC transport system ATP-binding protein